MKDWFASLAPRERMFVGAGALVVVLAIFFALVWAPLDRANARLTANVDELQRALAQLRPLRGRQPDGSGAPTNRPQQTPVVIVNNTSRHRGLDRTLRRSQPTTGNGIRVEFENVAFDDLVLWLGDLSNEHAMDVASGSVSVPGRGDKGRVNATLVLERAL